MADRPKVSAGRWLTPFEKVDPIRLHLLKVVYPCCPFLSRRDGSFYDFAEFTEDADCEIIVFREDDKTIYRISADAFSLLIHDERDLPLIESWAEDGGYASARLANTDLVRSLSGKLNGNGQSYLIQTGWDCVEFLCLNEPLIEVLGTVEDSSESFH